MKRALLALALILALAGDVRIKVKAIVDPPQACLSLLPLTEVPLAGAGSWLAIEGCP
jgi:hypothetical protein